MCCEEAENKGAGRCVVRRQRSCVLTVIKKGCFLFVGRRQEEEEKKKEEGDRKSVV